MQVVELVTGRDAQLLFSPDHLVSKCGSIIIKSFRSVDPELVRLVKEVFGVVLGGYSCDRFLLAAGIREK